jgi:glucose-6-phosphate 1-dehydrogenase
MATFVIFGATGNLALTKLLPAFYHLLSDKRLPEDFRVVTVGRRDYSPKEWCVTITDALRNKARKDINPTIFQKFCKRLDYFKMDIGSLEDYEKLSNFLKTNDYSDNIAYYLSMSPSHYRGIVKSLHISSLLDQYRGWKRVVVEKPFGFDEVSASQLQEHLLKYLSEEQIFRIDHYLGKSMVQNIMIFRFANILMEPLWNHKYIDHIQITHSEDKPIGSRAGYYDGSGAMRDMIQSHLLQLLALITLEPPLSMDAEALRDEKVKLLQSIRKIDENDIEKFAYRAQYAEGRIDHKQVKAYREEKGVKSGSVTETYAALKLYIDNQRWKGVPFYLETGKNMAQSQTLISVCFKYPDQTFFNISQAKNIEPNWIVFRVQPDESIKIEMTAKQPGLEIEVEKLSLDASLLPCGKSIEAYEDLLLDIFKGDRSLFLRYDEVKEAWRIVDPIIKHWTEKTDMIDTYTSGSWGPEGSKILFDKEGQSWRHNAELDPPKCKI